MLQNWTKVIKTSNFHTDDQGQILSWGFTFNYGDKELWPFLLNILDDDIVEYKY